MFSLKTWSKLAVDTPNQRLRKFVSLNVPLYYVFLTDFCWQGFQFNGLRIYLYYPFQFPRKYLRHIQRHIPLRSRTKGRKLT